MNSDQLWRPMTFVFEEIELENESVTAEARFDGLWLWTGNVG
jgi:hypothetical protein